MIESELYYLVKSYRDAIEQAHKKKDFVNGHLINSRRPVADKLQIFWQGF